jgi:hypothetical protein
MSFVFICDKGQEHIFKGHHPNAVFFLMYTSLTLQPRRPGQGGNIMLKDFDKAYQQGIISIPSGT